MQASEFKMKPDYENRVSHEVKLSPVSLSDRWFIIILPFFLYIQAPSFAITISYIKVGRLSGCQTESN